MPAEQTQSPARVANVPPEVTGQPRRVVVGSVTWRDTFAALKHRNYRLFFAGQFVSLIGGWMQITAQGWLVYQLTGSKVLLGTVTAVGSLPMLLLSVWAGSLADRHPKRTVILFTQTGMMLLAFVFAALVWSGRIQPWHILVLAALGRAAMAFDMPFRQAFTVEMTSREDLMNAISLNSSIFNGARIVGPSVAGFLMVHVGVVPAACHTLASGLAPRRPNSQRTHEPLPGLIFVRFGEGRLAPRNDRVTPTACLSWGRQVCFRWMAAVQAGCQWVRGFAAVGVRRGVDYWHRMVERWREIATGLSAKCLHTFSEHEYHHNERCGWVGPPPKKESVKDKSSEKNTG
jgi:MFS family permease